MLMGELLSKTGLQQDFDQFLDGDTAEAKLNNFRRLAPTFRVLEVPFDANLVREIMKEKEGIAVRVAYQLYISLNSSESQGSISLQKQIDSRKLISNRVNDTLFQRQLTRTTQRQIGVELDQMEEALETERLTVAHRRYLHDQRMERKLEATRKAKIKEAFVRAAEVKKERDAKTREQEERMKARVESFFAGRQEYAARAAAREESIRSKRKSSSSTGPVRVGTPDRPRSSERLKPLKLTGARGGTAVPGKSGPQGTAQSEIITEIRARRKEIEHARTQRDKRRRRVLQTEANLLKEAETEKRKALQLSNVMKRSQQERRIATQLVQARDEQRAIRENRAFRERQQRERRRQDFAAALEREAALAATAREQNKQASKAEEERLVELREARSKEAKAEREGFIRSLVSALVDLATKCGERREVTSQGVPANVYREWKELFVAGAPIEPDEDDVPIPGGAGEAEEAMAVLDEFDFANYHQLEGPWAEILSGPKPVDVALVSEADTKPDGGGETAVNDNLTEPPAINRVLGHVLDRIADVVAPVPAPPEPPQFPPARLRAAVIGKSFGGKSDALKAFAVQHGSTVISVEALMERAMRAAAEAGVSATVAEAAAATEATEDAELDTATTVAGEPPIANGVDVDAIAEIEAVKVALAPTPDPVSETSAAETAAEPPAGGETAQTVPDDDAPAADLSSDAPGTETEAARTPSASDNAELAREPSPTLPPITVLGQEIAALTAAGKPVSAVLMARLVAAGIREAPPDKGWVIDGFPASIEQAKELEKALTGRDEEFVSKNVRWTSDLAPVADDEKIPPNLEPPCGLDAVVHVEVPDEVAVARAKGRRVDTKTGEVYHLEGLGFPKPPDVPTPDDSIEPDNDPATAVLGLHERLQPIGDPAHDELQLQRRLEMWERESEDVLIWYMDNFSDVYHEVDGNQGRDLVIRDLTEALLDIGRKEERAATAALMKQLSEEAAASVLEESVVADIASQTAVEADIKAELAADEAWAAEEAEAKRKAEEAEAAASAGKKKKGKDKKKGKGGGDEELKPEGADLEAFIQSEEAAVQKDNIEAETVVKPGESGYQYVSDDLDSDLELYRCLHTQWTLLEGHYKKSIKLAFRGLRSCRDDLVAYLHQQKLDYADFLARPDTKQEFVAQWQQAYNSIPLDMRDDPETKAELHMRASELQDSLWDICTNRDEQSEAELDAIRNDGFIHDHVGVITNHFTAILQTELDRYKDTVAIIEDYYVASQGEIIAGEPDEAVPLPVIDVIAATASDIDSESRPTTAEVDTEQTVPTVPRTADGKGTNLEHLASVIKAAVTVIPERENPTEIRATKAAEEAALLEKEAKGKEKAKKPKKGEPAEEELPTPTAEELLALEAKEAKAAIFEKVDDERYVALTVEDARFKSRVELIQAAAAKLIEEVWTKADALWGHMALCSKERMDAETSSILQLIADVQAAIEAEERLLHELTLQGKDYKIEHAVYMFEPPTPPPKSDDPVEDLSATSFTIAQLEALADQFAGVAPTYMLPTQAFAGYLHGLSVVSVGSGLLPESWLNLPETKVKVIAKAVSYGSHVDWRTLVIAAAAIPTATPVDLISAAERLLATANFTGAITLQQLLDTELWFDAEIRGPKGEFDRVTGLKQLLFRLVKDPMSETAPVAPLVQWLARLVSPSDALRIAVSVQRGVAELLPAATPIESEELYAALHRGAVDLPTITESKTVDPIGKYALQPHHYHFS